MNPPEELFEKVLNRALVQLGKTIKDRRRERGWTQRGMAQRCRISLAELEALEKGEKNLTMRVLMGLSLGLGGCSMAELMAEMERRWLRDTGNLLQWCSLVDECCGGMETVPKARRRRLSE